eukprot:jgi/Ulvmu1/8645/UM046_0050.1
MEADELGYKVVQPGGHAATWAASDGPGDINSGPSGRKAEQLQTGYSGTEAPQNATAGDQQKLARRRQTNRDSQARHRRRQVNEMQQAEYAVDSKQAAVASVKTKRLELLVSHRVINRRCVDAAAEVLRLLRAVPTGSSTPAGSAPTFTAAAASGRHANAGSSKVVSTATPEASGENRQSIPEPSASQPLPRNFSASGSDLGSDVTRSLQEKPVAADAEVKAKAKDAVRAALYVADIMYEPKSELQQLRLGPDSSEGGNPRRDDSTAAKLVREARAVTSRLAERRRQVAEEHGVHPHAVRWVVQSPYAAEDGRPLSFTSAMLTPQCLASLYTCHLGGLLEEVMLAEALQQVDAAAGGGGGARARSTLADAIDPSAVQDGAASVSSIVRALDTALAGVGDVGTFPLLLTCGVDGTAPVATTVPHIVRTTCRYFRRILTKPRWLRMCEVYVGFMAGLTQEALLEQAPCPHREVLPDGTEVHAASLCPRCSVFAQIMAVLRDEVNAVAVRVSWTVEAVPVAFVHARAKEVFTFCDLLLSQCMTDQPIAFWQMMCSVRGVKQRGLQAEQETVLYLFRQMQLSHAQQRAAASMWSAWQDMRSKLDTHFANALMPLAATLGMQDVILDGGPNSHGHSARSVDSMRPNMAVDLLLDGKHRPDAGVGGGVCICDACATNMGERLLGASGRSMESAHNAMLRLARAQRREAAKFVELLRVICIPDALFTTEQHAQQTVLALQQGAMMDWLWLCKSAKENLEREDLFESMHRCLGVV